MSKDRPGNRTANTPDLGETELRALKMDELRERAKADGVGSTSGMRKDDLIEAISRPIRPARRRNPSTTRAGPERIGPRGPRTPASRATPVRRAAGSGPGGRARSR